MRNSDYFPKQHCIRAVHLKLTLNLYGTTCDTIDLEFEYISFNIRREATYV
jgi:hypothetical protein